MRYNTAMTTSSTPLSGLIARQLRCSRPAAASAGCGPLSSMLLAGLSKRAQYLGEASRRQHRFATSISDMDAQRARAAAQARAAGARRGLTGDKYYDNLPDIEERRGKELAKRTLEDSFRSRQDLMQRKGIGEIKKEVDAGGPTTSWGDNKWVRGIVGGLTAPVRGIASLGGSLGLGVTNLMEGRGFTEGQKDYWKSELESSGDVAHDIANNFQLQANAARHGAATVGRAANHYLRPSTWKNDAASKAQAWARKNEWANADMKHHERASRIFDNFTDSTLKDDKSTLGLLNYGLNTAVGEFTGAEAATAGLGTAAGAAAKGITRATRAASGAVRGTGGVAGGAAGAAGSAAGSAGSAAGTGLWQGTRNMAARGVDAVGDTVAMPFRVAGSMATPVTTSGKALTAGVRDGWQTLKNGTRPVRDLYGLIRHPQQAWQSFRATPWQHAWRGATYPVRWAWNTGKPIGRHVFSDDGFKALAAGQAIHGMSNNDYGAAGSALGDMAAYGALGSWYMPFAIAQGMVGGGDEGDGYGYG